MSLASWLRGVSTANGDSQGRSGVLNQIIGLKEDKDPEELTYMSDISGSLLCCSSRGVSPRPFSPGVHLCLASVLTNHFSLCWPTCCCAVSLIINFAPTFMVSASVINVFFTGGKDPGKNRF